MKRAAFLIQLLSVTMFIGSNVALLMLPLVKGDAELATLAPRAGLALGAELPKMAGPVQMVHLYLHPVNLALWALLLALWVLLLLDVIGQWQDPSEPQSMTTLLRPLAWPALCAALLLQSLWPWMIHDLPWVAAFFGTAAAILSYRATALARSQGRPAIGFAAGWMLVTASAMVASAIATSLGMTPPQASLLGILLATGAGMSAQIRLGSRVAFSVAVVWGFCALAATTMGFDPMTSIAAILGISGMVAVLIRAAS